MSPSGLVENVNSVSGKPSGVGFVPLPRVYIFDQTLGSMFYPIRKYSQIEVRLTCTYVNHL
jgi:hypothetical protein